MIAPIMFSKLQPPPARSEMVARLSLLERLGNGLRSGEAFIRKLTLFSAPAGYVRPGRLAVRPGSGSDLFEIQNGGIGMSA
jgi:hypothetical protein